MFTLGLIYTFIYILIFLCIFILSFMFIPLQILTEWSLLSYLVFLQKYTNIKYLFLLLIFSLTGLPPVGLFFVKFNILAFLLYQNHLSVIFFFFLVFFCNMLYYIQLFNIKNYKKNIYASINSSIFKYWDSFNTNSTYVSYHYLNFIVLSLSVIFLIIFIYLDLYLLLKCN